MSCPYFEEGYIGSCSASESRYVPSIEVMETYCFKKIHRLCPTFSKYLCKNHKIDRSHRKELVYR